MRKDLRIGLGIGGVLLAVLIVSLVVRSNNNKKLTEQANLDAGQVEGEPAPPGGEDPSLPAGAAGQPPTGVAGSEGPQMPPMPNAGGPPPVPVGDDGDPFAKPDATVAGATGNGTGNAAGTSRDWNFILARDRSDIPAPAGHRTQPPAQNTRGTGPAGSDPTQAPGRIARADNSGTERVGSSLFTGSRTPGERSYVVKPGETMISIARSHYGNSRHYLQIIKANPGVEPETMKPGTRIVLPELSTTQAEPRAARGNGTGGSSAIEAATAGANAGLRPVDPKVEYRIQSGDSLARISQRLYGTELRVDDLYNANRDAIGPNRERLKVGMVLRLPEAPASTASR